MSQLEFWKKLSESDHHTTTAEEVADGVVIKNQSYEGRRIDGCRVTVQVAESMVFVPNAKLEQKEIPGAEAGVDVDFIHRWVVVPRK